jgi:Ala-tRNA(Pro) deacylase
MGYMINPTLAHLIADVGEQASGERLRKHLGGTPGSVSLLALINDEAHAIDFTTGRALRGAAAIQAHPPVNTATTVFADADFERFLAATAHLPSILDVPRATASAADDAAA